MIDKNDIIVILFIVKSGTAAIEDSLCTYVYASASDAFLPPFELLTHAGAGAQISESPSKHPMHESHLLSQYIRLGVDHFDR